MPFLEFILTFWPPFVVDLDSVCLALIKINKPYKKESEKGCLRAF